MNGTRPPGGRLRTALRAAVTIAIIVGIFVVLLPRIADLSRVRDLIASLNEREIVILLALSMWNIVSYWPIVMAAMPGLSWRQAILVNHSSTTVAMTLPAGGALALGLSSAMYSSWGVPRPRIALSALVTGIWTIGFKLLLPAVALVLLALESDPGVGLVSSALLGVAVVLAAIILLALALRSEAAARGVGASAQRGVSFLRSLVGRRPVEGWGEAAAGFRSHAIHLIRRRWPQLTVWAIVSQISVFLVMLASARFLGIAGDRVTWIEALAVFAFVRLGSSLPILPGNVGVAELGYIGGLVLAGAGRAPAVAAVLVFRVLTFFVQIPIGGVTYLIWRRTITAAEARPAGEREVAAASAGR